MSLVARVTRAFADVKLDPELFERAAGALLSSRYPWLVPVEGGTDLGRDADIYRSVADDPHSRGRVLVTTGDPLANLKRSEGRWTQEGLSVDQIVIACSQPVGARARRKIDEFCESKHRPLPEIYARDWFIKELIRDAFWREALLGIKGRLEALYRASHKPHLGPPFVGRDEPLARLRDALAGPADVLLAGVPGVGKTRLLQEISGDLMFVEPLARDYLADDLMAFSPSVVVVDDAHLHLELMTELVRLRIQDGHRFSIVASTWPASEPVVGAILIDPVHVQLDLLPRTIVDAIVQSTGVIGVRARNIILGQAAGRPGWALALCEIAVKGDGTRVASGAGLLDQVERYLRREADSSATLDAVACIAAIGGADQEDLERVSELVGVRSSELSGSIQALATNGLIDFSHDRWLLQPALHGPLVTRWFFDATRHRSWQSITTAFPDRATDQVGSLLRAAASTNDPRALAAARSWAAELPSPVDWDETILDLVQQYAQVDEPAADFASAAALAILNEPTASVSEGEWGYDGRRIAARGIIKDCMQRWFNSAAVKAMLTLSVGEDAAREHNSDHPMRLLRDMARLVDPDVGAVFQTRGDLITWAREWFNDGPTTAARWSTFTEAIRAAFSPEVEGSWLEPGGLRALSFVQGIESPERMALLIQLWDEFAPALDPDHVGSLDPSGTVHLIDLVWDWVLVAAGHGRGPAEVSDLQRSEATGGAWTILRTVSPLSTARDGLALRMLRVVERADRWGIPLPEGYSKPTVDTDLLLLAGRHDIDDDVEGWMTQREQEAAELARRVADLGPADGVRRLQSLHAEMMLVKDGDSDAAIALALARTVVDPASWLASTLEGDLVAYIYSLYQAVVDHGEAVQVAVVSAHLNGARMRAPLIRAVLDAGQLDDVTRFVIDDLRAADANLLDLLYARPQTALILRELLSHAVPEIRALAVLAFDAGGKHGVELPDAWRGLWREAFLDVTERVVTQHGSWRLSEVLKHLAVTDPALCTEWFRNRIPDLDRSSWDPRNISGVAATLPQERREELARLIVPRLPVGESLLKYVIGRDPELTDRLLTDEVLSPDAALSVLSGEPDAAARALIPVLVAHGVDSRRIVSSFWRRSWSGNESDVIKADIGWFELLRKEQPSTADVCGHAIDGLKHRLDRALANERDEQVHGWL